MAIRTTATMERNVEGDTMGPLDFFERDLLRLEPRAELDFLARAMD